MFSNKGYNVTKAVALVWLPALGTLYWTLSAIWNLPHTEQVIGSITAVDTFLGAVLHLSTKSYQLNQPTDGQVVLNKDAPGGPKLLVNFTTDPADFAGKDKVVLQVQPAPVTLTQVQEPAQPPPAT